MKRYRRKKQTPVVAIQLDLDCDEWTYRKWGGEQNAKRGDWLVRNGDEVYTVGADTFEKTYQPVSLGVFEKTSSVWARRADQAGTISTKAGSTVYGPGDYLVFNDADGIDGYAVKADKFESLYETAD